MLLFGVGRWLLSIAEKSGMAFWRWIPPFGVALDVRLHRAGAFAREGGGKRKRNREIVRKSDIGT